MGRVARWLAIGFGGLVAVLALAAIVVYASSEWIVRRTHEVPAVAFAAPADAASIAAGRRLAIAYGCFGGCHGREAAGAVMFDVPPVGRIVAPNLHDAVRTRTDAELALAIRAGLRPDGRSLIVMPSEAYSSLTDEDLGRIVAFLRSLPPAPGPGPSIELGPAGRLGLVIGKFRMAVDLVAERRAPPAANGDGAARGRYFAQVACGHCHSPDLGGASNPEFTSPNLAVVAAYTREQFGALLRTGVAVGGREVGIMSQTARVNLAHLTDAEVDDLYAYLHALAAAPARE